MGEVCAVTVMVRVEGMISSLKDCSDAFWEVKTIIVAASGTEEVEEVFEGLSTEGGEEEISRVAYFVVLNGRCRCKYKSTSKIIHPFPLLHHSSIFSVSSSPSSSTLPRSAVKK